MSFTKFLVSFACHIAKPSLRALKTKTQKTYVDRSLWSKVQNKTNTKKKQKKAIDREIVDNFCSLS